MEYPQFKVCIRCLTYNQSSFITNTMDGFVMQRTDFPFVCCIVDDASTDGEQTIIQSYLKKNFDLSEDSCHFNRETDYAFISYARHKINTNCYFVVLFLKENLYSKGKDYQKLNYTAEWEELCKYLAICEGDDFWTEPLKIQIQSDFLEANPQCGLTYAKVSVLDNSSGEWKRIRGKSCLSFTEMLYSNHVPSMSAMVRFDYWKDYFSDVKPYEKDWQVNDYPIWLWMSLYHTIHFDNMVIGVYRFLPESLSHTKSIEKGLSYSESMIDIVKYYIGKGNLCIKERSKILSYRYVMVSRGLVDNKRYSLAKKYAEKIQPNSFINFLMKSIFSNRLTMLIYRSYRKYRYRVLS